MICTDKNCLLRHSLVGIAQNLSHLLKSHKCLPIKPGIFHQITSCLYLYHLAGSQFNPAALMECSILELSILFQAYTIQI